MVCLTSFGQGCIAPIVATPHLFPRTLPCQGGLYVYAQGRESQCSWGLQLIYYLAHSLAFTSPIMKKDYAYNVGVNSPCIVCQLVYSKAMDEATHYVSSLFIPLHKLLGTLLNNMLDILNQLLYSVGHRLDERLQGGIATCLSVRE